MLVRYIARAPSFRLYTTLCAGDVIRYCLIRISSTLLVRPEMFIGRDDVVGHTALWVRIWSTSHFYGERYILEQSEWPNPSIYMQKDSPQCYVLYSCRYPERSTQSRQLPARMHSVLRGCGYPLGLAHICSPCGCPPITIHDSRFSPSPPQGVNTASSGEAESL